MNNQTITAFLAELVDRHLERCDNDLTADIVSVKENCSADIVTMTTMKLDDGEGMITLALSDKTTFTILIEQNTP